MIVPPCGPLPQRFREASSHVEAFLSRLDCMPGCQGRSKEPGSPLDFCQAANETDGQDCRESVSREKLSSAREATTPLTTNYYASDPSVDEALAAPCTRGGFFCQSAHVHLDLPVREESSPDIGIPPGVVPHPHNELISSIISSAAMEDSKYDQLRQVDTGQQSQRWRVLSQNVGGGNILISDNMMAPEPPTPWIPGYSWNNKGDHIFWQNHLVLRHAEDMQSLAVIGHNSQKEYFMGRQCDGAQIWNTTLPLPACWLSPRPHSMTVAEGFNVSTSMSFQPVKPCHAKPPPQLTSPSIAKAEKRVALMGRALPVAAVAALRTWLGNSGTTHPNMDEKDYLSTLTGLTVRQITNWFSNYRMRKVPRSRKPMEKRKMGA